MDWEERNAYQQMGQRLDWLTREWEKEKKAIAERENRPVLKKGKPYLQNRTMYPACRTFRLCCCALMIGMICYALIYYPISAMAEMKMALTVDEWAMIITGCITSEILFLSMYREIKYGGYKPVKFIH